MKINTALAPLLLAASMGVSAHGDIDEHCDIQLNGNLKFENNVLTVLLKDGREAQFIARGTVSIDGNTLPLSREQTHQAQTYYANIQDSIPTTIEIAKEAVSIANTAVVEVFGELLGHDDGLTQEFGHFFDDINYDINNQFYAADGTIFVDTTGFEEGEWVDQGWEQQFEQKIESLIAKSMGKILIAVGSEMLWGDGDADEFGKRMENFGEELEQRLAGSTARISEQANALCKTLEYADIAENKLADKVEQLQHLDLLTIDIQGQRM
jgi:hypothetical protein